MKKNLFLMLFLFVMIFTLGTKAQEQKFDKDPLVSQVDSAVLYLKDGKILTREAYRRTWVGIDSFRDVKSYPPRKAILKFGEKLRGGLRIDVTEEEGK